MVEVQINKFEKIRDEFPLVKKYVYLDTATTGVFSTRSRNAMVDFIEKRYSEGMDIDDFQKNWEYADKFRDTVAEVINSND